MRTHADVGLTALAERLCCEYAGALPPGQIMALVFRANHMVATPPALTADVRLTTVEAVVRRLLTERLAVMGRAVAAGRPVA